MNSPTPSLASTYAPGTQYFYGYPAGEDSGFYNAVPPFVEELVSARPLVCAGPDIEIISFAAAVTREIRGMLESLNVPLAPERQVISLPEDLTSGISGAARNARVREALLRCSGDGRLVMAQPFSDPSLNGKWRVPAERSIRLNDKASMPEYIPEQYLPRTIALFPDGAAFARSAACDLPCVVKVSSSSSGDGVAVCRTEDDLRAAQARFADVQGEILAQEFVASSANLGVQVSIPEDRSLPVRVLGCTRQMTSEQGEYEGGLVDPELAVPAEVQRVLEEIVLPRVRDRGWSGVGAIDTLVRPDGSFVFIDPNFRMSAATAFLYESRAGIVRGRMATFTGRCDALTPEVRRVARVGAPDQMLNIIAAAKQPDGTLALSAALCFDQEETRAENAARLLALGVRSSVLESLARATRGG